MSAELIVLITGLALLLVWVLDYLLLETSVIDGLLVTSEEGY